MWYVCVLEDAHGRPCFSLLRSVSESEWLCEKRRVCPLEALGRNRLECADPTDTNQGGGGGPNERNMEGRGEAERGAEDGSTSTGPPSPPKAPSVS